MVKPWSRFEMKSADRAIRRRLAVCCLLIAGCSGPPDRPATAPVEGTVTYRGKPVADAAVAFLGAGAPRIAGGTTDAAGRYRLTTFAENDGAVLGVHTVAVKKNPAVGNGSHEVASPPMNPADMAKAIEKSMNDTALQMMKAERDGSLLPERYGDLRTSPLRKEVVAGNNVINIELTD
jgi:hypothetical protein